MLTLITFIVIVAIIVAAVLRRIHWLAAVLGAVAVLVLYWIITGRLDNDLDGLDAVVRVATLRM